MVKVRCVWIRRQKRTELMTIDHHRISSNALTFARACLLKLLTLPVTDMCRV